MKTKKEKRIRRHHRIRKKIIGTKDCPRLSVCRTLSNLYAQLIDDLNGKTLIGVSTCAKEFRKKTPYAGNVKAAELLGETLAQQAKEKGISKVVFDRGGFLYHGRIRAFAESCRKQGLQF